jgi:3-oxoadipate enol-lactonase
VLRHLNDVDLWVEEQGAGPAVLLLHGIGTSLALWDAVAAALAPSHRVIRFDLRGFGKSAAPANPPYSLGLWARDARAVLVDRKAEPAIVVGHGLGASVAMEMALDFPPAVRGIVLVGAATHVLATSAPLVRQQMEAAERQGMAAVAALQQPTLAPARADLVTRYRDLLVGSNAASFARAVRATMQVDLSERMEDLAKPTLVVVGQQDAVAPPNRAREIEEGVSGARLAVLPGVGHLAPLEAPAEVAQAVTEFSARAGRF